MNNLYFLPNNILTKLFKELKKIYKNDYCKDQIWVLIPKGGWISAQRSQNNEFVENGLEKPGLNKSDRC